MVDIIHELEQKLMLSSKDAEKLHVKFDGLQLSLFRDARNNASCAPCGRRYSDCVEEFATTHHYYSPKAYQYVRSIFAAPIFDPKVIQCLGM